MRIKGSTLSQCQMLRCWRDSLLSVTCENSEIYTKLESKLPSHVEAVDVFWEDAPNNAQRPLANLSKFNNGAYISGIKVFNHLPQYIKALTNDHKCFKSTLKRFLYHHSFYSMNEYYEHKEDRRI